MVSTNTNIKQQQQQQQQPYLHQHCMLKLDVGAFDRKKQFARHVAKLNESYLEYFRRMISNDPSAIMIRASQG